MFAGVYSLQLANYFSLPDATRYGRLLGVNPILVRFPNFVPLYIWLSIAVTVLGLTATIIVLPRIRPDLKKVSNQLFFSVMLLQSLTLLAMSIFIYSNLIGLFERAVRITEANLENIVKTSKLSAIKEQEVKYLKVRLFFLSLLCYPELVCCS